LSRKQPPAEEGKAKVPAFIVTFSDMVTLLLTFFVMLLSLAQMQDPELFYAGQGAFVRDIRTGGLGVLLGRKRTQDFDQTQMKYPVSEPDEDSAIRTIDAKEERIRRLFKKVTETMETRRSALVAERNHFSVTNIAFSSGESQLNEAAKEFLTQFAANLQQDTDPRQMQLYVLGLAPDEQTEKKQWILSARRAQAVADFLERLLPSRLQCPVYSWGAGPGGYWVTPDGPVSEQSQILIAVLR